MITAIQSIKVISLTWGTFAVEVRLMVCDTHSASLPGQDLEDKCLDDERYHDFKDHQCDDVEAEEVESHKPVHFGIKF